MESVDSDEGSSNAPKHKPAPQKKRGVQKQQKRGPGRPRKHPSPSDPDKKKALQPRGGITKVSACSYLPFAEQTLLTPLLPSISSATLLLTSLQPLAFQSPSPACFLTPLLRFLSTALLCAQHSGSQAGIAADYGLCKASFAVILYSDTQVTHEALSDTDGMRADFYSSHPVIACPRTVRFKNRWYPD